MRAVELIERIRTGREARRATEELYELTQAALLSRIRSRIPQSLGARLDAEDILHEAFLKTLKALDRFRPESEAAYLAWIYCVARNLITDQGKRRSAIALHFNRDASEKGLRESRIVSRQPSPESQLLRADWVESMLGRLSEREAEVIRLRVLEARSFEEIALLWDKTPGAVQRFFSRAWARLRALARPDSD